MCIRDSTELARVLSPSSYVDALKAPILIVYSGSDDAVYPLSLIHISEPTRPY